MEDVVTSLASVAVPGIPSAEFWRSRRVLVTGHSGFIGGWTCAWLQALGSKVSGYALAPPSDPSFHDLTGLAQRIAADVADIRDASQLASAFEQARPQVVLHLAAQPIVREAYDRPAETFDVNLMGTVQVLEQSRRRPPEAVIAMTSDKVYANGDIAHGEGDRIGPGDPYGSSKACCELAVDAYTTSFLAPAGIGVASVRAGNVIGGGDWGADRLVPDAVRAFAAGQTLSIRRPEAVRPWQHVLDAVSGLLLVAEQAAHQRTGIGAWNIGPTPGAPVSVGALADMLAQAWGEGARVNVEAQQPFPETGFLAVDSRRARNELSWQPPWAIERSVAETAAWYRRVLSGGDAWEITQGQIADYGADRARPVAARVS